MEPSSNYIHPTAIVEGDVSIGSNNYIGPFAYISGPVTIGNNNWIGAYARIGAVPEIRTFDHFDRSAGKETFGVTIGNHVVIRESAQIHSGWKRETKLDDGCFIMNQVYIAHDCELGVGVTVASSALFAGNVSIGYKATIGLGATIHQGRRIGSLSMVGMASVVTKDVPAFTKYFGSPAVFHGINDIGMMRDEFSPNEILRVRQLMTPDIDFDGVGQQLELILSVESQAKLSQ